MARFQSTIINAETPLRLMNKGNGICPPVFQRHGKCKPIHPLSTPRVHRDTAGLLKLDQCATLNTTVVAHRLHTERLVALL